MKQIVKKVRRKKNEKVECFLDRVTKKKYEMEKKYRAFILVSWSFDFKQDWKIAYLSCVKWR